MSDDRDRISEAYVTMKVYWNSKTCPERAKGANCVIHPRKPKTPTEVNEDITAFFSNHSTVFKIFVTSVGGIKTEP